MPTEPASPQTPFIVACLCADWCGTCRDYQPLFAQLQQEFPDVRFVWIDIEDEADLVDPIEIDNFPTLLITAGDQPRFFGTVLPHIETLRRLIQTHQEPSSRPLPQAADLRGLVRGLTQRFVR
jgi:thioredoxin 1